MRKFLFLCLSLMLLLFPFAGFAHAAETVGAEIPVVIEGGGTAYVISEVNCPLPQNSILKVDNGRTGRFDIAFTEPGVYHYTVKAEFLENGTVREADKAYRVTVEVYKQKNGALYTVTTINSSFNAEKEELLRFDKKPEPTTVPPRTPETPTNPGTTQPGTTQPGTTQPGTTQPGTTQPGTTKPNTTQPGTTKPPKTTRPPRTGDESNLTRYVLVAMASSLGLFLLAMLYTVNTNKLIREDDYFD